jgi:2-polyprenyl-3-methyl-5-hydroxy-6-metoxy-1,4-benzoquinol methylase
MNFDPTRYYKNDQIAENYDKSRFNSLAGRVFERLEKNNIRKAFRDLPRGSTIVDVPCGTGRLAEVLLEDGFKVVGMDISPNMLAQAQKKLERFGDRFTTRVANMLEPDAELSTGPKYDAALCARVLMHFPPAEQAVFLRSVASLVNKRVVFTHSWSSTYQLARRGLKRLLGHQRSVRYPLSRTGLAKMVSDAGLCEQSKLRLCPPLTEEVIVTAVKA